MSGSNKDDKRSNDEFKKRLEKIVGKGNVSKESIEAKRKLKEELESLAEGSTLLMDNQEKNSNLSSRKIRSKTIEKLKNSKVYNRILNKIKDVKSFKNKKINELGINLAKKSIRNLHKKYKTVKITFPQASASWSSNLKTTYKNYIQHIHLGWKLTIGKIEQTEKNIITVLDNLSLRLNSNILSKLEKSASENLRSKIMLDDENRHMLHANFIEGMAMAVKICNDSPDKVRKEFEILCSANSKTVEVAVSSSVKKTYSIEYDPNPNESPNAYASRMKNLGGIGKEGNVVTTCLQGAANAACCALTEIDSVYETWLNKLVLCLKDLRIPISKEDLIRK